MVFAGKTVAVLFNDGVESINSGFFVSKGTYVHDLGD